MAIIIFFIISAFTCARAFTPLETPILGFDLADVSLDPNTFQARAAASNLDYLLQLEPDRMLYAFRNNAGLPKPGIPFYGTWEDPGCELRGHFVGHYLTALAYAVVATGMGGRRPVLADLTALPRMHAMQSHANEPHRLGPHGSCDETPMHVGALPTCQAMRR